MVLYNVGIGGRQRRKAKEGEGHRGKALHQGKALEPAGAESRRVGEVEGRRQDGRTSKGNTLAR